MKLIALSIILACSFLGTVSKLATEHFAVHGGLISVFYHITIHPQLVTLLSYLFALPKLTKVFFTLFLSRYIRLLINILGFLLYTPTPKPLYPTLTPNDVTVIVPTIDPSNKGFGECIGSILANRPASVVIVTAGG